MASSGSCDLPIFDVLLSKLASAWHLMSVRAFSTTLAFTLDKKTTDGSSIPLHSKNSFVSRHSPMLLTDNASIAS